METVNIYAAKTQLSRLVDRALKGEAIVIARNGQPLVRLTPCQATAEDKKPRQLGRWKGQIWVSPDFDAPDAELEDSFYNGPLFPDEKPETT
jgi:prevent-host-death family protein